MFSHSFFKFSVQEMERIRQQIVKKKIEEKDNRIERLKIKREREIMDCKAQAQYTAELRDQLRFFKNKLFSFRFLPKTWTTS